MSFHLERAGIDPESFDCQWYAVHDFNEPNVEHGATPQNWSIMSVSEITHQWAVELSIRNPSQTSHGEVYLPIKWPAQPNERLPILPAPASVTPSKQTSRVISE